jgi:hypothetical protein
MRPGIINKTTNRTRRKLIRNILGVTTTEPFISLMRLVINCITVKNKESAQMTASGILK